MLTQTALILGGMHIYPDRSPTVAGRRRAPAHGGAKLQDAGTKECTIDDQIESRTPMAGIKGTGTITETFF